MRPMAHMNRVPRRWLSGPRWDFARGHDDRGVRGMPVVVVRHVLFGADAHVAQEGYGRQESTQKSVRDANHSKEYIEWRWLATKGNPEGGS